MIVKDLISSLQKLNPDSNFVIIEGGVSIFEPSPPEKVGDLVSSSLYWSDLPKRGLNFDDYVLTVY